MKSVTRATLLGALMHALSGVGKGLVIPTTRPARQRGFGRHIFNKISRKVTHNEKSAPLQEQLIAAAQAKRERRARERFYNYTRSINRNPCLRGAA